MNPFGQGPAPAFSGSWVEAAETGELLNIHKPAGPTSFQLIREVRRILQEKKVGHCGTLDPMAEGVLLILFGKATRHANLFMSEDKVYRAEMRLGMATDTGDVTGRIIEVKNATALPLERLEGALGRFKGPILQVPPMYSALKWKGRKLYEYARKGVQVERPARNVTIHSIEVLSYDFPFARLRVHCSKGTYVRSLVEDIGRSLGLPATLSALTRERSGPFSLEDSLSWDSVLRMSTVQLLSKSRPISSFFRN